MESFFDLDVEHMSPVFVSYDGQLENMLSMSDVFDIFSQTLLFQSCSNPLLLLTSA